MADAQTLKRKEPETETKVDGADAPQIAVAVKPAETTGAPEAKKQKTAAPSDPATIRKQIEYYLSDDNLKHDKFFHDQISKNADGWLELNLIMSCNKMKAMSVTSDQVLDALKESKVEVKDDKLSIRRPGNLALPTLEARPMHQKKSAAHAHDGGIVAIVSNIPAEQSWMQVKDKLREKLPDKVQLWFVSEVTEKATCTVSIAPFDKDMEFFEKLDFEVGGAKLTVEVAQGDALQGALKIMPKHIRDKREKELRKRQKERNRPIVVGQQRFVTVHALRLRVKEIVNSRSDGEQLKVDSSDYKLIKAMLSFHPKGEAKSKGMTGIKVAKSSQGDSRCFWLMREDGTEEDFSAQKCLGAIEANPPYVESEAKVAAGAAAATEEKKPEEKKEDDKKIEETKEEEPKKDAA